MYDDPSFTTRCPLTDVPASGGISQIPKEDAAKLEGPSVPFIKDPDNYIIEMDVFHQLHCLVSCTLLVSCQVML